MGFLPVVIVTIHNMDSCQWDSNCVQLLGKEWDSNGINFLPTGAGFCICTVRLVF